MVIERMPPAVAMQHQPRVWLTGFTVGAPLLHIGQIRMTYTCSGLDFAQVYPNGTEMRDV
jgi:hypothetical protein